MICKDCCTPRTTPISASPMPLAFAACLIVLLQSCSGKPDQVFTEYRNGPFKAIVRSQEFGHSAIRNIGICMEEISIVGFPKDRSQCFLHGYDFSKLSVTWTSERSIEISYSCGKVSSFQNTVVVSPQKGKSEGFHARLNESCDTK
jgi:hypothetical protein